MSVETIVIWIAIGLAAGWLASLVVGGGYGVVGDIVLGIVGAFLGGADLPCPAPGNAVQRRGVDDIRRLRGLRCPVAAHASGQSDHRAREMIAILHQIIVAPRGRQTKRKP